MERRTTKFSTIELKDGHIIRTSETYEKKSTKQKTKTDTFETFSHIEDEDHVIYSDSEELLENYRDERDGGKNIYEN